MVRQGELCHLLLPRAAGLGDVGGWGAHEPWVEFWRCPLLVLWTSQSHEVICQGKGSFFGGGSHHVVEHAVGMFLCPPLGVWPRLQWTVQRIVRCSPDWRHLRPETLTSIPSGLG